MAPGTQPDFQFEQALIHQGVWPIAGVDEAGRGPLAGAVAAAAVILNPDDLPSGLNDSKKLTASIRERLFDEILARALSVSVSFASTQEIDILNIRAASLLAMRRAVAGLALTPVHVLIDGNVLPASLLCPATCIIKGDGRALSIAAASIVAKVTRDRLMHNLHRQYPLYGFASHMGYGTPAHLAALIEHGPSPFHRHSFEPVRASMNCERAHT